MAGARERRRTCLWLAEAASWRCGVIGRLVKRFGGFEEVIDQPRERLAAFLAERGGVHGADAGRRAGAADAGARGAPPERGGSEAAAGEGRLEAAAFALTLAAARSGPSAAGAVGAAVSWVDDCYPARLRQLYDPPPALFVDGACGRRVLAHREERPVVAVVGARGPSPYGLEMARAIARDLVARGAVVVSGLALGIDAAAQEAALRAGAEGRSRNSPCDARGLATLAVLGCGIDVVYPRSNARLFAAMRRSQLLVSEFVWGVPARAWRFPARNRVIAGLSHAVVIVEGSERSGSLITAELALEVGREVFAVPGEAGRRLSAGPHRLLRQGAHLCESADDVLQALGVSAPPLRPSAVSEPQLDADTLALLRALDAGEQTPDDLAGQAGLTAPRALALLGELEVDGLVTAAGGGRYRVVRGTRGAASG